jgi:hypothetical protein
MPAIHPAAGMLTIFNIRDSPIKSPVTIYIACSAVSVGGIFGLKSVIAFALFNNYDSKCHNNQKNKSDWLSHCETNLNLLRIIIWADILYRPSKINLYSVGQVKS